MLVGSSTSSSLDPENLKGWWIVGPRLGKTTGDESFLVGGFDTLERSRSIGVGFEKELEVGTGRSENPPTSARLDAPRYFELRVLGSESVVPDHAANLTRAHRVAGLELDDGDSLVQAHLHRVDSPNLAEGHAHGVGAAPPE